MKRLLLVAILLIAASVRPAGADSNSLNQMLQARADAVRTHSSSAYMATVDPQSSDAFKASERNRFDGLSSIPLADYGLTTSTSNVADMADAFGLADHYKADNVSLPETDESFRLGDYDTSPMHNTFWYTYVQRAGKWYAASLNDADVVGLRSTPNFWDSGTVAVQATAHFLVMSNPDQQARAKVLGDVAENAMARFENLWPLPWAQKIPLILPATPEQAASLLRLSNDVAQFAAFTSYQPQRDKDWQASPPRLFVEDENLSGESITNQQGTLVHELTHAASAPVTGPDTPIWLQEGMAEWMRLGKPAHETNSTIPSKTLPESSAFMSSDHPTLTKAYSSATSAVEFLAAAKGARAPFDLLQAIGQKRAVIGSPAFNFNEAMQQSTGWTVDQFQAAWQSHG